MFISKVACYYEPVYKIAANYFEKWQCYSITKFSDNDDEDLIIDTNSSQILVLAITFHLDEKRVTFLRKKELMAATGLNTDMMWWFENLIVLFVPDYIILQVMVSILMSFKILQ